MPFEKMKPLKRTISGWKERKKMVFMMNYSVVRIPRLEMNLNMYFLMRDRRKATRENIINFPIFCRNMNNN